MLGSCLESTFYGAEVLPAREDLTSRDGKEAVFLQGEKPLPYRRGSQVRGIRRIRLALFL
jgi:hypothetical protein